ncbi:MAG: hypothetical protein ABI910_01195 [Gemmatimonadota bacterium]
MKRFALAAAIVMLAACGGAKEEAMPAVDTAAAAMTPAPAMDSSAMSMDSAMSHDSAADTTMKH